MPKYIDLRFSHEVIRDPFDNTLVDRNLDDLWFTIEHYYHEHSPGRIEQSSNVSNKTMRPSRSNQKKNEKEENTDTFDISEYIKRKNKHKETTSLEKNARKSFQSSKKENKNTINVEPKRMFLKRKVLPNNLTKEITTKKLIKATDLEKKPKIVNISSKTITKNNPTAKTTTSTNLIVSENNLPFNSTKNHLAMNINKNITNQYKNDKNISQDLYKNRLRTSKSNPKSAVGHSFIQESSNLSMNFNNNLNVSYVPAMHGTREIRRVNNYFYIC